MTLASIPAPPAEAPAGASVDPAEALRADVLRAHGASDEVAAELLVYGRNRFSAAALPALPLADEPFVAAWEGYAADAEREGVLPALRRVLVQLAFPIAEGTSERPDYQAATRRGELPAVVDGRLALERPDALRLLLHPTPAGRIPVLVTACRADFESLARALTMRNEPRPVPASMGAVIVGGYNDWARVRAMRRAWEAAHPDAGAEGWAAEWRAIVPQKELYQDRFILLSDGDYSAVPAGELGLEQAEWTELSLRIRLEHECCHYFTRRVFGSMHNSLHDELMADYSGLRAATGRFRADWFLRFLGLDVPDGRPGGRMDNYLGDPPLGEAARAVLRSVVRAAARNLEALDRSGATGGDAPAERARTLVALASLSVEALGGDGFERRFAAAVDAQTTPAEAR